MGQPTSTTLGVFGYLPGHPDFVRVRAAGREVRRLEDWLERGLHQARWDMGGGFAVAYPRLYHRFLFRPDNSDRAVMGLLCASQDCHQRPFPFAAFDLVQTSDWDAQAASLIARKDGFFTTMEALIRQVGRLSHIGQIHGQVASTLSPSVAGEAREAPAPPTDEEARYANFLQETTCGDLGGSESPGHTQGAGRNGLALCWELIALLGSGSDPRLLRHSILIPLGRPAFARQLELRFYVSLLSMLVQPHRATLTLFWQLGGTQPGVLLASFREPTVDSFSALLRSDGNTRGVWQPGRSELPSQATLPGLTDATPLQELLTVLATKRRGSELNFQRPEHPR